MIKDSGHRKTFETGAMRDMSENKGRMDLLPWQAIMELSKQEEYIINMLREAKPYEQVTITKDKNGLPETYLILRSQKIMISQFKIQEVK